MQPLIHYYLLWHSERKVQQKLQGQDKRQEGLTYKLWSQAKDILDLGKAKSI